MSLGDLGDIGDVLTLPPPDASNCYGRCYSADVLSTPSSSPSIENVTPPVVITPAPPPQTHALTTPPISVTTPKTPTNPVAPITASNYTGPAFSNVLFSSGTPQRLAAQPADDEVYAPISATNAPPDFSNVLFSSGPPVQLEQPHTTPSTPVAPPPPASTDVTPPPATIPPPPSDSTPTNTVATPPTPPPSALEQALQAAAVINPYGCINADGSLVPSSSPSIDAITANPDYSFAAPCPANLAAQFAAAGGGAVDTSTCLNSDGTPGTFCIFGLTQGASIVVTVGAGLLLLALFKKK